MVELRVGAFIDGWCWVVYKVKWVGSSGCASVGVLAPGLGVDGYSAVWSGVVFRRSRADGEGVVECSSLMGALWSRSGSNCVGGTSDENEAKSEG